MRESKWTENDLKILTKYWHKVPNKEIGLMIGKSGGAVRLKAEKYITIEMRKSSKWSEFEDKLLLELYGTMPIEELSERMKRTERSIFERLKRMEGTQNVTVFQDVYTCSDIALFLGLNRNTITMMYKRNQLPMNKISSRKALIETEVFWDWLKDNLDIPNYLNIKDSTQLISPEWYQEVIKKKKQEDKDNKSRTKWSSKEDALLWAEIMKGTPYKEIAEKVNRTVPSVACRVVRLTKKKMDKIS